MEFDNRALPLTRGQLDIWLADETGHSSTEWQVGLLVRIEGTVDRDALEWTIRRVVREAEPIRVACVEAEGQVFQSAIDYPDVELAFFDLLEKRVNAILATGATGIHFFGLQPAIKHLRGVKIWTRACDALREEVTCFIREKICSGGEVAELSCSIR